jgi:hypothetical protein
MAAEYRELEVVDYNVVWVTSNLKTGGVEKSGIIHKVLVQIVENEEVLFEVEQYWIRDDEKGTILDDKGDRKLFDTSDEALIYVVRGKTSKIEMVLDKMKKFGFKGLSEEEQTILKNYNQKNKKKNEKN